MNVYFDTCALNRLTDDLSQPRVRREAEAVAHILDLSSTGVVRWIASTALRDEIERNTDLIRRLDALSLISSAATLVEPNPETNQLALEFALQGLSSYDAIHLALAQQAGVDWLISTDDRFIRRAQGRLHLLHPQLINPVDWLQRRQAWRLPNQPL